MKKRGRPQSAEYTENSRLVLCRILGEKEMEEVRKAIGAKDTRAAVWLVLEKYLNEIKELDRNEKQFKGSEEL